MLLGFLFALGPVTLGQDKTTFADHVRPLLQSRCFSCHNPDKKKGGLDLTSYAGLLAGGSGGGVVEGGNHAGSRLWTLTARKAEPFMPPEGDPLKPAELDFIAKWVDGGLLETASSVAKKTDKPKLDLVLTSTGEPEGPPPMPQDVLLEPVLVAERGSAVTALAASPWAPLLAVSGAKQVLLFHTDTLELAGVLRYPEGFAMSLRFSRNGALLVVAGGHGALEGNVVLFDVKTGRRVAEIGKELDTVLCADLRADHRLVAFGTPGKKLKVYDAAGNELYVKDKHSEWVTAVGFSPDGVLLASGDRNGGLRVWESDTGGEYLNLEAHKSAITALAWRPDSNVLASSSEDGEVILWEMNNGGIVKRWTAHGGGTLGVDYSHDGKLVTSGRDRHVRSWKGDGTLIKDIAETPDLPTKVAFLHDSARITAGLWNGEIAVWPHDSGQALCRASQNPPALETRIAACQQKMAELTPQTQAAAQARDAAAQVVAATEKALADIQKRRADAQARAAQLRRELAATEQQATEAEQQAAALAPQLDAQRKDLEAKTAAWQKPAGEVAAHLRAIAALQAAKFNVAVLSEKERLAKLEAELEGHRATLEAARAAQADAEKRLVDKQGRMAQADKDLPNLEAAASKLNQELVKLETTVDPLRQALPERKGKRDHAKQVVAVREEDVATAARLVEEIRALKAPAAPAAEASGVAELDQVRQQVAAAEKALAEQLAAVTRLRGDLAQQATNALIAASRLAAEADRVFLDHEAKVAELDQAIAAKKEAMAKTLEARDQGKRQRQAAAEAVAELEQTLAQARQEGDQAQAAVTQVEPVFTAQKAKVAQLHAQYLALLPK